MRHALPLHPYCIIRLQSVSRSLCSSSTPDYYGLLGLSPSASAKDIKSAYYCQSKKWHPDTNRDKNVEISSQNFQRITAAYEVLGSPERRRLYDANLLAETRRKPPPSWAKWQPDDGYKTRTGERKQPVQPTFDQDYRNFVDFQRHRRRTQRMSRICQMPPEFSQQFGQPDDNNSGEGRSTHGPVFDDDRPLGRTDSGVDDVSGEEQRLRREVERDRRDMESRFGTPTFEQMHQEKLERFRQQRQEMVGAMQLLLIVVSGLFLLILFPMPVKKQR